MAGTRRRSKPMLVVPTEHPVRGGSAGHESTQDTTSERDAAPSVALGRLPERTRIVTLDRLPPRDEDDPDRGLAEVVLVHGDDVTVRATLTRVAATSVAFGVLASPATGPLGRLIAGDHDAGRGDGHDAGRGDGHDAGRGDGHDAAEVLDAALAHVLDAPLRRVDLGEVAGEHFLTTAVIGDGRLVGDVDPDRSSAITRTLRRGVRLLRRRGRITVHVDGVQRWRGRTPVVAIVNSPLLVVGDRVHRLEVAADPVDGELDVAVLAPRWPHSWVLMWLRELLGMPHDLRDLRVHHGAWVHVHAEDVVPIEVDGDRFRPTTMVDLVAEPAALTLFDTRLDPAELDPLPSATPPGARPDTEHDMHDRTNLDRSSAAEANAASASPDEPDRNDQSGELRSVDEADHDDSRGEPRTDDEAGRDDSSDEVRADERPTPGSTATERSTSAKRSAARPTSAGSTRSRPKAAGARAPGSGGSSRPGAPRPRPGP